MESVIKQPISPIQPRVQRVDFKSSDLDKNALWVVGQLLKSGYQAYLVGGCVRDLLLNKQPKDFDISTSANPEQIKAVFKRSRIIGRRFRLVHVLFGRYDFLEVSTFRSGEILASEKNNKLGNKVYGTIEQDVLRRDFTLNALYYDIQSKSVLDYVNGLKAIKTKKLVMIGTESSRYKEDPVRLLRAVRFKVKFELKPTKLQQENIKRYAPLLKTIPSARLYEEVLKLFHNEQAPKVLDELIEYGLMPYLFPNTKPNAFIGLSLNNTVKRIKAGQGLSPSFFLAVFLWEAFLKRYRKIFHTNNNKRELQIEVGQTVLSIQKQYTSFANYLSKQVIDTWLLQFSLEKALTNKPKVNQKLLEHPRFRAAYDFLLLRVQSGEKSLLAVEQFWDTAQKKIIQKNPTQQNNTQKQGTHPKKTQAKNTQKKTQKYKAPKGKSQ